MRCDCQINADVCALAFSSGGSNNIIGALGEKRTKKRSEANFTLRKPST